MSACSVCLLALKIWAGIRAAERKVRARRFCARARARRTAASLVPEAKRRPRPCTQRTAGHNRKPEGKPKRLGPSTARSHCCRFLSFDGPIYGTEVILSPAGLCICSGNCRVGRSARSHGDQSGRAPVSGGNGCSDTSHDGKAQGYQRLSMDMVYPGCISTGRLAARLRSSRLVWVYRGTDLGYAPAIEVASWAAYAEQSMGVHRRRGRLKA